MGVNSGTPPNTMFFPWGGTISTATVGSLTGANQIQLSGFYLPDAVTFSNIVVSVQTADAGNNYDWGIYDSSGKLKAHVGAQSIAGTGVLDVAVVGGPITLQPGKYYFAFTGAATTAILCHAGGPATVEFVTFLVRTESATVSVGGVLPALATMPADSWTVNNSQVHGFALH